MRLKLGALTVLLLCAAATNAGAVGGLAGGLDITHSGSPDLGTIVYGASSTVFSVDGSGAVSRLSGNAIRITAGAATPRTYTVGCGNDGFCNSKDIIVSVSGCGGPTRLQITQVSLASTSGVLVGGAPSPGSSITFRIQKIGKNSTFTFKLGHQVTVSAGAPAGRGVFTGSCSVSVSFA